MNPEQIAKVPKQFCENVIVAHNPEAFVLLLSAGETGTAYALSPEHAKRMLMNLQHHISQYEKDVREIKTEWSQNTPSPFKISDIKGDKN